MICAYPEKVGIIPIRNGFPLLKPGLAQNYVSKCGSAEKIKLFDQALPVAKNSRSVKSFRPKAITREVFLV